MPKHAKPGLGDDAPNFLEPFRGAAKRDRNYRAPDAARIARDVNIVDKGWNNVPEEER